MASRLPYQQRLVRAIAVIAWSYSQRQAPGRVIFKYPSDFYSDLLLTDSSLANDNKQIYVVDDDYKAIEARFENGPFYANYDEHYDKIKIYVKWKQFEAEILVPEYQERYDGWIEGFNDKRIRLRARSTSQEYEFEIYPKL